MAKPTPKSPVPLEAFLRAILAGDDKHRPGKALPPDLRTLLEATLTNLTSTNSTVRTSRETYRSASKARKAQLPQDLLVAEQIRHGVQSLYDPKAEELSDYGLAPRKRRKHKDADGATSQPGGRKGARKTHESGNGAASPVGSTEVKTEGETPKPSASTSTTNGAAEQPATH